MNLVYSELELCFCLSRAAGVPVCPPAALSAGLRLLCVLLQHWEQLPAGAAALTGWLLGEADSSHEASGLVRICWSVCTHTFPLRTHTVPLHTHLPPENTHYSFDQAAALISAQIAPLK